MSRLKCSSWIKSEQIKLMLLLVTSNVKMALFTGPGVVVLKCFILVSCIAMSGEYNLDCVHWYLKNI